MERGNWKRPVFLEIFGRPGVTIVRDTLDAALVLLGAWPHKRTAAHMAAVTSCRDVLAGRAEPALARVEFIEAALEAGFCVQPETFIEEVQLPAPREAAAESREDGDGRRLPSILSFARRAVASRPAGSNARSTETAIHATDQSAAAGEIKPTRWPPPAWASIALDHEIADHLQAEARISTDGIPAFDIRAEEADRAADVPVAESGVLILHRPSPLPAYDFDDDREGVTAGIGGTGDATATAARIATPIPYPHPETPSLQRIEWSAVASQSGHSADSPRLGELLLRLFDTLAMIGLVTVKTVAGVVHLNVHLPGRGRSHGPAGSH